MAVDEELLAELKETKSQIDELQERLKSLVSQLQEKGATTQEITAALRG